MATSKRNVILWILIGVMLVLTVRIIQVKLTSKPFKAQPSFFTFQPPKQALQGTFTELTGEVKKNSIKDSKFHPVKMTDKILQGESVITDATSSAVIALPDTAKITVAKNVQLGLPTLLKDTLLVKQNSGVVQYSVLSSQGISVRALHALFELKKGVKTISINEDGTEITVRANQGDVMIGMLDKDNNTQITTVKEGETATIDNEEKSIDIK